MGPSEVAFPFGARNAHFILVVYQMLRIDDIYDIASTKVKRTSSCIYFSSD